MSKNSRLVATIWCPYLARPHICYPFFISRYSRYKIYIILKNIKFLDSIFYGHHFFPQAGTFCIFKTCFGRNKLLQGKIVCVFVQKTSFTNLSFVIFCWNVRQKVTLPQNNQLERIRDFLNGESMKSESINRPLHISTTFQGHKGALQVLGG